MKHIDAYINESNIDTVAELLLEGVFEEGADLESVYFDIYHAMTSIDEGLFASLAQKLSKLADKAQSTDNKIQDTKAAISDAAKNAIEKAKSEAGNAWDSIKDIYTDVVTKVDNAVQKSKASIEATAKEIGVKVSDLESTVAKTVTNAIANGKEKVGELFNNDKTGPAASALITALARCKKSGLDNQIILAIINSAGIN